MSQALQLGLERRRQLAGKVQVLARHRVIEPQGGGVEQQAMGRQKPAAGARVIAQIHSFSHQRVPLFCAGGCESDGCARFQDAHTARLFDMETSEIGKMSQPGESVYGVELSNGGLISFGGGIPLKDSDGMVIGAIGVSGSSVDNDVKVAQAAVEAYSDPRFTTA